MWGDDDEYQNDPYPSSYPRGYASRVEYQGPRGFEHLPPPGYSMPRTSAREIIDLAIAIAVLTFIFALAQLGGILGLLSVPWWAIAGVLGLTLVAVVLSIFPHELAHKFLAQRYGYWAEFRRDDRMILMSLGLFIFLGFGIAGAGAVMIAGPVTTERNGKISAIGPATNGLMAAIFFPIALFSGHIWWVQYMAGQVAWINVVLGVFNMLPIGILDGAKIWKWSAAAYLGLLALLIALGAFIWWSGV